MSDKPESIFYRLYVWVRQNTFCRLGVHEMRKVFADDTLPNPEFCTYCGKDKE